MVTYKNFRDKSFVCWRIADINFFLGRHKLIGLQRVVPARMRHLADEQTTIKQANKKFGHNIVKANSI